MTPNEYCFWKEVSRWVVDPRNGWQRRTREWRHRKSSCLLSRSSSTRRQQYKSSAESLVFGALILEPYFDLQLGDVELVGQRLALNWRHVSGKRVFGGKATDLSRRKHRPPPLRWSTGVEGWFAAGTGRFECFASLAANWHSWRNNFIKQLRQYLYSTDEQSAVDGTPGM